MVEEEGDLVTIWWKFFEKEEKIVFKLDEPVDYLDKGFSLMLLPPSKELKESIRYDDMTIDLK